MAENFGVQGRGAFYDHTGAIRDVIENHLFQVLSQPRDGAAVAHRQRIDPRRKGQGAASDSAADAKTSCADSSTAILNEKGVAPDSQTETFAAVRLFINSCRWNGVPFYIRAGKESAGHGVGDRRPVAQAAADISGRADLGSRALPPQPR